jgi:hypothetical protein
MCGNFRFTYSIWLGFGNHCDVVDVIYSLVTCVMYLSITNKLQRYTMIFITINALHVSGGSSVHQQELKTVYTASGICRAFTAPYRLR